MAALVQGAAQLAPRGLQADEAEGDAWSELEMPRPEEDPEDVTSQAVAMENLAAQHGNQATPKPKLKSAAGKGKANAKAKAEPKPAGPENSELKRCLSCHVDEPADEFQQRQTKCKECRNSDRQLQHLANRQGKTTWLNDLRLRSPKEYSLLNKVVQKVVPDGRGRRDFNLAQYIENMTASSGIEHVCEKKMMWEDGRRGRRQATFRRPKWNTTGKLGSRTPRTRAAKMGRGAS